MRWAALLARLTLDSGWARDVGRASHPLVSCHKRRGGVARDSRVVLAGRVLANN